MSTRKAFLIYTVCLVLFTTLSLAGYRAVRLQEEPMPVMEKEDRSDDGCPERFDRFASREVIFCYPFEMELVSQSSASDSSLLSIVFSSEHEELVVSQEQKLYPIHLCNQEIDVEVASTSAKRISFKSESIAGCGSVYRYLVITNDPGKVWSIDMRTYGGSFDTDEDINRIVDTLRFP